MEAYRKEQGKSTIPARIFQTWKTKENIPPPLEHWSRSFQVKNPDFAYELWDDHDNREFIRREFPWFLSLYDGYPSEIYRADVIRYFYLYTSGGIYVDMDTECLRPLDEILGISDVVLGRMGLDTSFVHSIPNAIMASRPREEFWLFVIALLKQHASGTDRPEYLTGPVLLKTAVDLYLAANKDGHEASMSVWWLSMATPEGRDNARLEVTEHAGRIEGFYSGLLGRNKPVIGRYEHNEMWLSFSGNSPLDGALAQVKLVGDCSDVSGCGTMTVFFGGRRSKGTWTVQRASARQVSSAIGAIANELTTLQRPEPWTSRIEILDGRRWFPIDWSNPLHEPLRLAGLQGELSGKPHKKLVLFPDALMVTYWAHTWEQQIYSPLKP